MENTYMQYFLLTYKYSMLFSINMYDIYIYSEIINFIIYSTDVKTALENGFIFVNLSEI